MRVKKILIYAALLLVSAASVIVIIDGLLGDGKNSLIDRVFHLRREKIASVEQPAPQLPKKRITLLFAGDLMQHTPQIEAARQESGYNYDECFNYIAPLLRESDIAVVNLETTLSETPPYSGYPRFKAPAELAAAMKSAGVDAVLLANNHICDRGATGMRATVDAVGKNGITYTGAFADSTAMRSNHPLIIERGGITVSILNYTYGTNGLPVPKGMVVNLIDTVRMAADLAALSPEHLNVVCVHWGEEYQIPQNRSQQKLAEWLHEKGADLVIGSHPHVVQQLYVNRDSENNISGATVYSLGNFVSNQTSPIGTEGGMVVRFVIEEGGTRQGSASADARTAGLRRRRQTTGSGTGVNTGENEDISRSGLQDNGPVGAEDRDNSENFVKSNRSVEDRPAIISAENFYVWSYKPVVEGRRRYIIVPSYMAEELLAEDASAQAKYDKFLSSVRATVGDASGFTELRQ